MEEIQSRLDTLEDYSASLELDIQSTQEQLQGETDGTHIVFLNDHFNMLKFEQNKSNAEIYIFREKQKSFN